MVEQSRIEQYMQSVIHKVGQYGWMVQSVFGTDTSPPWSYTVGFWQNYRHPEIVVFGLPQETAGRILNDIGDQVSVGTKFEPGAPHDEIVKGHAGQRYECVFINVHTSAHGEYFGVASNFYHGRLRYRVRQLVWPDPDNRLPFETGYDPCQPILDEHWAERN